jgi:glycosyltransferase involved in cell wall biosynthesis
MFEPPDGGAPEVVLNLALGMARYGWDVCVAGPERASIRARLERADVEYLPVRQLTRGGRSPVSDLRALRSLDARLRSNPVDVIHCHSSKAGVLGRLLGARRGVPVVYSPHCFAFVRDLNPLSRTFPALVERLLAPLTAAFVCVCESERRAALQLLRSPERAHCIYNGVPAPHPDARADRALLELKGDGLLVGAVTVLREQKRLDVLIDAIPSVLAEVPEARFAIIGNGPLGRQLQQRAAARGLGDDPRLAFLPFSPPSERYLSALDLYVLPSAWEALPIGLLEALACGVPQVATDVGGTAEAVSSATGRLVPPKQPEELAGAITTMLRSPQLRAHAATASRARHSELFDAERMVRETVAVYERLATVSERSHAPASHPHAPVERPHALADGLQRPLGEPSGSVDAPVMASLR